jgi:hypothetical protein
MRSADAAELLGDLLGAVVHDLGSITAALDLRAGALGAGASEADGAALRALAAEVRDITRTLRLLRGPAGSDALAPGRMLEATDWWRLVSRLTKGVLPRSTVVHATLGDVALAPRDATMLAYAWLAACRDAASRGLADRGTIAIDVRGSEADGSGTAITAYCEPWPGDGAARSGRWHRFVARLPGIAVDWWTARDGGARWHVRTTAAG